MFESDKIQNEIRKGGTAKQAYAELDKIHKLLSPLIQSYFDGPTKDGRHFLVKTTAIVSYFMSVVDEAIKHIGSHVAENDSDTAHEINTSSAAIIFSLEASVKKLRSLTEERLGLELGDLMDDLEVIDLEEINKS